MAGRNSSMVRYDRRGTEIRHSKKEHKVTFADDVGDLPVADVVIVQSYKAYNAEEPKMFCWCIPIL